MRWIVAYGVGVVFGLGISLSGMANPAKVINFFDITGAWDPSLAFVMGGALAVTALGFALVLRRNGPVMGGGFHLPTKVDLDGRLIGGSALFGLGWGLAGFCPGGALPALGTGNGDVIVFVIALSLGIWLAKFWLRRGPAGQAA